MFSENNENINEEKNDEVMDTVVTEEYGAEQIQVLKGLEAVRKRPVGCAEKIGQLYYRDIAV